MKKTTALVLVVLVAALSVALYASLTKNDEPAAVETSNTSTPVADNSEEAREPATQKSYITQSEFQQNQSAYAGVTKVLFFHASWCPICQSIDKDISSDPAQIPESTVFIKTDFDSSTELRQKYGVTTQYTFVKIDEGGNELKQWSATNLDKAIAGI